MDFQIGKYMKVDKRLNYFRPNIEAGFMQSCSKSRSTLLPALSTTVVINEFWMQRERTTIIPLKKGIFKSTHRRHLEILVRVLLL